MKLRRFMPLVGLSILLAGVAVVSMAQDAPTDPGATDATVRTRLPKEYSTLPGMTDDEKQKILDIREAADKQITAIRDKETADMRAVLTDDQRKALDAEVAKNKEDVNARREAQRLEDRLKADQQKLDQMKNLPTSNPS